MNWHTIWTFLLLAVAIDFHADYRAAEKQGWKRYAFLAAFWFLLLRAVIRLANP